MRAETSLRARLTCGLCRTFYFETPGPEVTVTTMVALVSWGKSKSGLDRDGNGLLVRSG